MYSKELEELIESVLADGVVTDLERTVLRKRAQACGEDPDEVMIVVDGRLAKMKKASAPTTPTVEKRGNIVKCPSCGAPIEAGAVKCAECGYVFTNAKTNNSAERFAKELAVLIDKHKDAYSDTEKSDRNRAIREFIMSFPVPTGKEDMLEFLANLDAKRRNMSDYQSAYAAKYKECATKAKIQFAGDKQVEALLNHTEKFSVSKLTKNQIVIFAVIFAVVIIGVVFSIDKYNNDERGKQAVAIAETQCDSLCSLIDQLPMPTKTNYKDVEYSLLKITWKDPSYSSTGWYDDYERAVDNCKDKFLAKKRAIASQIYSIYKVVYPGENSNGHWDGTEANVHAPKEIYDPDYIRN